ncbi:MAG TPA: sugar phosphate isomerase/epimerase family protein [Nitrososphaeraceae archaeon]|nr:sugar phosphate isomerase/epimerase family protein [Nitrososphaeraceae archaeon]
MSLKYSITLSSFRNIVEPLEQTLDRLIIQGYDAVEMFGEPESVELEHLKELFQSYNISICAITGMWGSISLDGWKRKLLSLDQSLIRSSQKYVKQCIDMCHLLGGKKINICLFADEKLASIDKNHQVISEQEKVAVIHRVLPVLSELAKYANDRGIQTLLEPLNRYSTPFCSTASDAVAIAQKINQDNFGVLLDTFHMNIEEDSFENAIISSQGLLHHTHFADNNRKMPGLGHIDFRTIMKALNRIGYNSEYISFEPNLTSDRYRADTEFGLNFIKSLDLQRDETL